MRGRVLSLRTGSCGRFRPCRGRGQASRGHTIAAHETVSGPRNSQVAHSRTLAGAAFPGCTVLLRDLRVVFRSGGGRLTGPPPPPCAAQTAAPAGRLQGAGGRARAVRTEQTGPRPWSLRCGRFGVRSVEKGAAGPASTAGGVERSAAAAEPPADGRCRSGSRNGTASGEQGGGHSGLIGRRTLR